MAAVPRLSVVVPVFNEEENLLELHRRLRAAGGALAGDAFELLFVDDGSRDGSREILDELYAKDPNVRVIHFTRNFGHHIALTAGLDAASGERIVLMDADLQDLPEEIEKLWRKLDAGFDVAVAVRKNRKDGLFKRTASATFVGVMNRLLRAEVSLTSGVFRMLTRRVADELKRLREQHRFVVGLITWLGFRAAAVDVEHGARFRGETKYSLWKMVKLALNTMTAFSQIPLRLASALGIGISAVSFAAGIWIMMRKLVWGIPVQGWASLFVLVALLGGVQLVMLGIIGEYLGRVHAESLSRPLYVVDRELRHPPGSGEKETSA